MKAQRSDCLYQYNAMQFSKIIDYLHTEGNLTKEREQSLKTFGIFRYKPFYCWSNNEDDCFNHTIKLPIKNDKAMVLFDYEKQIFDLLESGIKYLAICKATGLGVTEFFLRYIAWRCLSSDEWNNCKVVIVTGPRIELSITLIDRMKKLFLDLGITFDTNQTVVELNGCRIEAYPSHHIDTMRGLTNVKMIMIDEGAFLPKNQQQETRDASERYIAKSDPIIVWVSTPNAPSGSFYDIFQEP